MLSSLLVLAFARGDEVCEHTSVCSLGAAKNVSNSTGMCIHDPFYPGTKVCEICDGCPWPACPCCNPLYNEAGACSLCQVQSSYFRERCGNPTFAVKCDHIGQRSNKLEERDEFIMLPHEVFGMVYDHSFDEFHRMFLGPTRHWRQLAARLISTV